MSRSNEAFWWSLFSAGGVVAALLVPALIVITGFMLPANERPVADARYAHLAETLGWWPVQVVLIVVIALTFFHCAHRLRHVLTDLGLRARALGAVCYGGAALGAVAGVILVARI